MNILFLSTSDSAGGAAIACLRLVEALRAQNVDAKVLVLEKSRKEGWIQEVDGGPKGWKSLKKHLLYFVQHKFVTASGYQYSGLTFGTPDLVNHPWIREADAICLHWINHGFIGEGALEALFNLGKPIIWHMHDFWSFTGGCHYPGNCKEFQRACNQCVALNTPFKTQASNQLARRLKSFQKNQPVLVGASNWLANEAQSSSLGHLAVVENIPNPVDPYFEPGSKTDARRLLNLSSDKKYVLFAAMNVADVRKGFHHLKGALLELDRENVGCIVAGKFKSEDLQGLKLEIKALGPSNKERMREAYRAADVFVIPSTEENLPNTVLESLACGTPVAGFAIGGIPEMVKNGLNGQLADTIGAKELAQAIRDALHLASHPQAAEQCVGSLSPYAPSEVASRYIKLIASRINKA